MSNLKDTALNYIASGLSVIPTKEDKTPALSSWKAYQSKIMTIAEANKEFIKPSVKGIAVICGAVSGNLEVIDVDTKYDITGTLWNELNKLIEDNIPEIYKHLVIAQTKSGGYHIYYKCNTIEGNLKLANRPTTPEERGKSPSDKVRVLIETRGEGGYVVAPDTKGYKYIKGNSKNIPLIKPDERELLHYLSKSFNEVTTEPVKITASATTKNFTPQGLGAFEDYNERGDIIELLLSYNWSIYKTEGERIYLRRAGDTKTNYSGNFHTGLRLFYVFSTSTIFPERKALTPSTVFAMIECNNDLSIASKRLYELGYGDRRGKKKAPTFVKTETIKVEGLNKKDEKVILSKPASVLKIENVKAGDVKEVTIYYTLSTEEEEILKSLELLEGTPEEIKIYLKEVDNIETLSKVKGILNSYEYKLQSIINKYSDKELNALERDNFFEEINTLISSIENPIDRDIITNTFLNIEGIKALGISKNSLEEIVEKLRYKKDKAQQDRKLKALLEDVTELQTKGETTKALDELQTKVREIKQESNKLSFDKLLIPPTEEEIKQGLSNKPDSLDSGYNINKEPLLLPSGAITIITAPTSHCKTTLLLNLALNTAEQYKDKQFHFFSYEEDRDIVLLKVLNIFCNLELNNRNNIGALKSYYSHPEEEGEYKYFKRKGNEAKFKEFETKKKQFFKELIETQRLNIHYVDYSSNTLIEAIEFINKKHNLGAVFIDYIQLLRKDRIKAPTRQEELKNICLDLKNLAVETGLPIILTAQQNREVINHSKLHATNIGEAGDIERVANTIIGLWNNNIKPLEEVKEKGFKEKYIKDNTLYGIVLKMREGKTESKFLLDFTGNTGKITDHNELKF